MKRRDDPFGHGCFLIYLQIITAVLSTTAAAACEFHGTPWAQPIFARPHGDLVRIFGVSEHPVLKVDTAHDGWDLALPANASVMSSAPGRVSVAGRLGRLGNTVVVHHGNGWETVYGHLARLLVKPGDCVSATTAIGDSGATGLAIEPTLHFGIIFEGKAVDPADYLNLRPN